MDIVKAAESFASMGSESRLEVLRVLVKAGDRGLSVGDIQQRTKIPNSTLNHHLKFLSAADLILQEKQGRTIFNRANYPQLKCLAQFILSECCVDEAETEDQS